MEIKKQLNALPAKVSVPSPPPPPPPPPLPSSLPPISPSSSLLSSESLSKLPSNIFAGHADLMEAIRTAGGTKNAQLKKIDESTSLVGSIFYKLFY